MDLCEERDYDTPPPEIQHGSPTKAKRVQTKPDQPEPSCVSMKSNQSMHPPLTFRDRIHSTKQRVQTKPDQPEPSCVSMKSNQSMHPPLTFRDRIHSTKQRVQRKPDPTVPTSVSIEREDSMRQPVSFNQRVRQEGSKIATGHNEHNEAADLASIFTTLEENIITFVRTELKKFQEVLSTEYPECLESQKKDENVVDAGEEEQRKNSRQALLKITLHFLRSIKQEELADSLQSRTLVAVCQNKLKSNLKGRFQCFFEGIAKAGNPTLLNEIYTELYVTEGGSRRISDGHEFRQIETTPRKPPKRETMIKCEDIFQPIIGSKHQPIRTVITNGEAGIGKTVLTQKFTLDWAEGKANHNIQFTFPFTFRELNLLDGKIYSLVELLHVFFTETKEAEITRFDKYKVVFIFDGLDECRLPLDFHNNEILTDVTKPASVDVLLTNLIRGKLLPSARLWITTRPAAANQVPPECVDIVTEVRGFTDTQKKEYFEKRFRDEEQATSVISHIKTSRSLHMMCHIPVFCWITASVLEHVLRADENKELPKTLTEMYVHFLVVQSKVGNVKYHGGAETDPLWNTKIIMSLGKLAFEHLQKGNLIFYESDLIECGIDIRAASVYSGVFTQIFKEDCGLYQDKVFCFVHLSIQEFLAALYVFVTFINTGVNLLSEPRSISKRSPLLRESKKVNLYQTAVDKALQSQNGHLDLFLRFLVGLSLETNLTHLQELLTPSRSLQNYQETVKYIQRKIRKNPSPERCINLFHCLNELNDHSLVEEIQQYLSSEGLSTDKLSHAQWSALVFILLSSEKDLEVFDLRKYSATEEGLLRLLQVVKASRISCLRNCKLSERSCEALASVLMYKSSNMRELDLSNNDLKDSGVWLLSAAVASPNCKLETLRLSGCNLSEKSCEALAAVLSSQTSNLRELDLSNNDLQDSGVRLLSAGVASPHCRLKTLRLNGCNISERSSEALASVLSSQTSSLRELDLSNNDLQDSGVRRLSAGVANQHCRLKSLRLSRCLVTEEGCVSLASALSSNPSHLKELDLSYNHPGASGVKLLSAGLEDPQWGLDTLCVDHGGRHRLKPFMYACEVTLDPNTANRMLRLSEDNRRVTEVKKEQPYPDHPDRFHPRKQVLCREGLSSTCYWEVEWKGWVNVGMTYRGIKRKGEYDECCLGENNRSWGLFCSGTGYSACHNKRTTDIRGVLPSDCGRVAVYLDWPAGTLSFYRVSSDTLIHLHTFNTTFTEPLYPVFRFKSQSVPGSYVSLCQFGETESVTV
ncbi:NACHT, LRR and PYD domains-containing protein 3 isoform X3 [Larimichthys crocea]|uniref:NACHT, LRR and PYD domains-containing protein 3 isoform X3 n=1 Tax=Larimichthys crocea TaxID=215358 RepID=UPI000F5F87F9|nr:NACHT, LRR and PYD domains-containing protein 3 isoform X3 [Larimichthys crocea]